MPFSHVDTSAVPPGLAGLLEMLEQVTDPRWARGVRHRLSSVLAVAALATLAGARSYRQIGDYAGDLPAWLLPRLRCGPQAPSEATLRRVLDAVDCYEADAVLAAWMGGRTRHDQDQGPAAAAMDAKTLRGGSDAYGPVVLLSAVEQGSGVVLAQHQLARGQCESALDTMALTSMMELSGRAITGDAAHTCRTTARHLVEDKNAAYLFTVKANTSRLHRRLGQRLHPRARQDPPAHTTTATGHGRTTTSQTWTAPASDTDFPHAAQAALIQRTTHHHPSGTTSSHNALLITALTPEQAPPALLADYTRGHWHIENKVHWVRDVVWDEDHHRTTTGARITASLRNLAMSLIRLNGHNHISATLESIHRNPARALDILDQATTPRL